MLQPGSAVYGGMFASWSRPADPSDTTRRLSRRIRSTRSSALRLAATRPGRWIIEGKVRDSIVTLVSPTPAPIIRTR